MAAYTKGSHTEIPHSAFHSFSTHCINLLTRRYTGIGANRRTTAKESNQRFITSRAKKKPHNCCYTSKQCVYSCLVILRCLFHQHPLYFELTGHPPYFSCFSPSLFIFMAVGFCPVISPPISDPSPLDCLLTWASAGRTSALTLKTPTWNASQWRSRRRSE